MLISWSKFFSIIFTRRSEHLLNWGISLNAKYQQNKLVIDLSLKKIENPKYTSFSLAGEKVGFIIVLKRFHLFDDAMTKFILELSSDTWIGTLCI